MTVILVHNPRRKSRSDVMSASAEAQKHWPARSLTELEKNMNDNTWTPEQEALISKIQAAETMHDPENMDGERRISCSRIEAIRRMRRRSYPKNRFGLPVPGAAYRAPSARTLAWCTEEAKELAPSQLEGLKMRHAGYSSETVSETGPTV
jgi:hypothetical protein